MIYDLISTIDRKWVEIPKKNCIWNSMENDPRNTGIWAYIYWVYIIMNMVYVLISAYNNILKFCTVVRRAHHDGLLSEPLTHRESVWTGICRDHGMASPRAWTSESRRRGPGSAATVTGAVSRGHALQQRSGAQGRTKPETRRRSSEATRWVMADHMRRYVEHPVWMGRLHHSTDIRCNQGVSLNVLFEQWKSLQRLLQFFAERMDTCVSVHSVR
jgi:hypothetical protein